MQTDDEGGPPIDFSALDPSRNKVKWDALVQSTMARAIPQVPTVWFSLATRGRMVLGFAAVIALLAWVPAFFTTDASTIDTANFDTANFDTAKFDTAGSLADWAARGDVPDSVNLYDVLGAHE